MLTIGMALIAKPRLLLLDEPLLGLSPVMQNTLVDAIKKIQLGNRSHHSDHRTVRSPDTPHDRPRIHYRERNADNGRRWNGTDGQP